MAQKLDTLRLKDNSHPSSQDPSTSSKKPATSAPKKDKKNTKQRTSKDVLNRLLWDRDFLEIEYLVGYEDRFNVREYT